MSSEEPTLERLKSVTELVGKSVLAVAGLCYVLGLVATNVYYNRLGVYSLSLFRLNYVIAGFWVIVPIVVVGIIWAILIGLGYSIKWYRERGRRAVSKDSEGLFDLINSHVVGPHAVPLVFFSFLCFVVVMTLVGIQLLGIHGVALELFGLFCNGTLVIGPIVGASYFAYRYQSSVRTPLIIGASSLLLVTITMHTFMFAVKMYGKIPAHLGGGGTKEVQLLLDVSDKDKKFFELSGLGFNENSNWTNFAELLFTTDDEFVLVVGSTEQVGDAGTLSQLDTLSIKRDLIKSVLYTKHEHAVAGPPHGLPTRNRLQQLLLKPLLQCLVLRQVLNIGFD